MLAIVKEFNTPQIIGQIFCHMHLLFASFFSAKSSILEFSEGLQHPLSPGKVWPSLRDLRAGSKKMLLQLVVMLAIVCLGFLLVPRTLHTDLAEAQATR